MTKNEAQATVALLVANSLRKLSRAKSWKHLHEFPINMTDADRGKYRKEMLAMADRLDKRFPEGEVVT